MKSKSKTKPSTKQLTQTLTKLKQYLWVFLLLFFIILYSYTLLNISSDKTKQPTQAQISKYLQTATQTNINPKVVKKLEDMQNNSISVKALFNQARQNPFN